MFAAPIDSRIDAAVSKILAELPPSLDPDSLALGYLIAETRSQLRAAFLDGVVAELDRRAESSRQEVARVF